MAWSHMVRRLWCDSDLHGNTKYSVSVELDGPHGLFEIWAPHGRLMMETSQKERRGGFIYAREFFSR